MIPVMTAEPIGRERESGLLDGLLDPHLDGLRVVVLTGEPGIGKSTLWEHAIAAAHERSSLALTSRPAETERGQAFLVLGDLFRDADPGLIASLPAPRRRALEAALLLGDHPHASVDSRALGVAVTTVLQSLAGERTVLIAIDDDQWADGPSAATLAFAIRRLADQRIRLLLARRTHGQPPVRLESLVEPVAVEHLEIGPLSMGATQVMLRDRLGITFARPTLRELHRVSGGNPFYALELGRARSRDASRDLALPLTEGSVDRLLQARIRGLDGATMRALLLIAAHGRAPIELLVSLDVDAGVLDAAVDERTPRAHRGHRRVCHPVLAAAVYDGAGGEGRRAAHRRLAAVIEDDVSRGRHVALSAAGPSRIDLGRARGRRTDRARARAVVGRGRPRGICRPVDARRETWRTAIAEQSRPHVRGSTPVMGHAPG